SIFFFFSSRRRHTRSKRDWSSDVCSSDLISTGDVATLLSPSTRTRGWPGAPASNTRRSRHCIVISATGPAISVAPPRGQPQIESIVFEVIHGVVLEQPVECGAIVKLDAHHEVGPEGRAIRI